MLLHLLATVRPTETWTPFHVIAVTALIVCVAVLVRWLRVRDGR